MDRSYWEKMAPGYNEEIFDVLHNDKKALIRSAIEKLANKEGSVIDIGCAIGKWLPVLSPLFKKVIAADISAGNLAIAEKKFTYLENIQYRRADMSSALSTWPRTDVAICINAILTGSMKKRKIFFANLSRCLKRHGSLVLVVPSLESKLLAMTIQQHWKVDANLFDDQWTGKQALSKYTNILQGNFDIDEVPTKHYLAEELQLLLTREGFTVTECTKIEYDWKTEFVRPPAWLKEPRPWDWMVVAHKN